MKHNTIKSMKGFTLVEVAVTLFVVGLLTGQLIPVMKVSQERKVRALTISELNEIVEAVYGFAIIQKRLPCPDVNNDYQEDFTGSQCTASSGNVPSATLGTTRIDYDGNSYRYEIDARFGKSNSLTNYSKFPEASEIQNLNGLGVVHGLSNYSAPIAFYVLADRIKTRF